MELSAINQKKMQWVDAKAAKMRTNDAGKRRSIYVHECTLVLRI